MAWELPTDPVYLDEMLRDSYQDGNLPLLAPILERSDNLTSRVDKKKKKTKTTPQPAPAQLPIFNSNQYLKQPPNRYYFPTNPNTNSQPHPYYTSYQNDKSPSLDRYYYGNGRLPQRPGAAQPNSDKLKYYLSYADKFFKEFSEMGQHRKTTGSAVGAVGSVPNSAALNRSDVK